MNEEQKSVLEFHKKYEVAYYNTPTFPPEKVRRLRATLIAEEMKELLEALGMTIEIQVIKDTQQVDMKLLADAMADSKYVIYGTAISYGIDLEPIFREVHRSNMTKSGTLRDDGKILKGEDWSPPDITSILEKQLGA